MYANIKADILNGSLKEFVFQPTLFELEKKIYVYKKSWKKGEKKLIIDIQVLKHLLTLKI